METDQQPRNLQIVEVLMRVFYTYAFCSENMYRTPLSIPYLMLDNSSLSFGHVIAHVTKLSLLKACNYLRKSISPTLLGLFWR